MTMDEGNGPKRNWWKFACGVIMLWVGSYILGYVLVPDRSLLLTAIACMLFLVFGGVFMGSA